MVTCKKCGEPRADEEMCQARGKPTSQCKECKKVYDRQYRKDNWDRLAANMLKYEAANPELIKEIQSRSKRKHSDRRNIEWHRRYALSKNARGSFTLEEWNALLEKYHHMCLACEKSNVKLTKDHIVPLSQGGSNWISNIQPLCQPCNSRKRDKTIDYREKYNAG